MIAAIVIGAVIVIGGIVFLVVKSGKKNNSK